jgi:hypothetical protein
MTFDDQLVTYTNFLTWSGYFSVVLAEARKEVTFAGNQFQSEHLYATLDFKFKSGYSCRLRMDEGSSNIWFMLNSNAQVESDRSDFFLTTFRELENLLMYFSALYDGTALDMYRLGDAGVSC